MTTPIEDPAEAVLDAVERLHAERKEAVKPLAAIEARRKLVRDELAKIDKEYALAYVAAEKKGWTEDQLAAINIAPPETRPPGRPARRSTARRATPRQRTAETTSSSARDSIPSTGTSTVADQSAATSDASAS